MRSSNVQKAVKGRAGKAVTLSAALAFFAGGMPLYASITGDPATDGWVSEGTSSAASNYIDGIGSYSATVYSTAFTLDPSSSLVSTLDGYDWNPGDTIVGVGGVFSGTNNDLTYSGGADEHGNSHAGSTSTRIVVKYGSGTTAWTTPGVGSLANGGVGSILLGTYPYDFYPADSGTLVSPDDSPEEQTGVATTGSISGDMGRVITYWNGSTLVGFESFADLTLLDSTYPSNTVALGNHFVLDLQRGTGNFQDSLGTLPTSVPEPASTGVLGVGAAAALLHRRRRPSESTGSEVSG